MAFHEERAMIRPEIQTRKAMSRKSSKFLSNWTRKRSIRDCFWPLSMRRIRVGPKRNRPCAMPFPPIPKHRRSPGSCRDFFRQGKQADAEEVFRQAAHDLADDPRGVMILADYYVRSGQADKARAEFASLAAQHPKNLEVQENYVRSLLQVNDNATARRIVAELMKKNSRNPQVQALNGILLLNEGKPGDAANGLQNAAKDYPNDAFIQLSLGRAQLAKGDRQAAEAAFRRALELAPNRLDAAQELARIAGQRGDLNLLADVADKAIAAAPRAPEGMSGGLPSKLPITNRTKLKPI